MGDPIEQLNRIGMDHFRAKRLLRHMDLVWGWPPTELEAQTLREVDELPRVNGIRLSPAGIRALERETGMQMHEGGCHDNVIRIEHCSVNLVAVHGWMVCDGEMGYIRHSVLRDETGKYVCVTPVAAGFRGLVGDHFEFTPDPLITCNLIPLPGKRFQMDLRRRGIPLTEIGRMGLRRDPQYFLDRAASHHRRHRRRR